MEGQFLSPRPAPKGMLHYYGEHFRTVEINNALYRMPMASMLETWAGEVPADFKFVLKASQRILHLQDAGDSVAYLIDVAGTLQNRLGALLFQLPPNLKKDVLRPASERRAWRLQGVASPEPHVSNPGNCYGFSPSETARGRSWRRRSRGRHGRTAGGRIRVRASA